MTVPPADAAAVPPSSTASVASLLSRRVEVDRLSKMLSDLPFAPKLQPPICRYGLACVAAVREQTAKTKPTDPAVWSNLLGALKSPGAWERAEPMFEHIRRSPEGPMLRDILERGQCGVRLARFGPIGAQGTRALEGALITTSDALLRNAAHPASRAELAKATKLDGATLESWAHLAELAVVLEIAYENDKPPKDVGDLVTLAALSTISDVKTMSTVNPAIVAAAMERANKGESRLVGVDRTQLETIVARWKAAAISWIGNVGREGASSMVQPSPPAPPEDDPDDDANGDGDSDGGDGGGPGDGGDSQEKPPK